jgi:hypothetical protein
MGNSWGRAQGQVRAWRSHQRLVRSTSRLPRRRRPWAADRRRCAQLSRGDDFSKPSMPTASTSGRRSRSTISSSPTPLTTQIADRCRSSRHAHMPSSDWARAPTAAAGRAMTLSTAGTPIAPCRWASAAQQCWCTVAPIVYLLDDLFPACQEP